MPVRQQMLVSASDQSVAERLHFDRLTDGKADDALTLQHERILSKMSERHQRTMERVMTAWVACFPQIGCCHPPIRKLWGLPEVMDVCPFAPWQSQAKRGRSL